MDLRLLVVARASGAEQAQAGAEAAEVRGERVGVGLHDEQVEPEPARSPTATVAACVSALAVSVPMIASARSERPIPSRLSSIPLRSAPAAPRPRRRDRLLAELTEIRV